MEPVLRSEKRFRVLFGPVPGAGSGGGRCVSRADGTRDDRGRVEGRASGPCGRDGERVAASHTAPLAVCENAGPKGVMRRICRQERPGIWPICISTLPRLMVLLAVQFLRTCPCYTSPLPRIRATVHQGSVCSSCGCFTRGLIRPSKLPERCPVSVAPPRRTSSGSAS